MHVQRTWVHTKLELAVLEGFAIEVEVKWCRSLDAQTWHLPMQGMLSQASPPRTKVTFEQLRPAGVLFFR